VQEAVAHFVRNHTVLVIAHRLSTVVGADELLVLKGGLVVQRGSHSSLMKERGLYRGLWNRQVKSSAPTPT
jgi:ATP-binding cassette subfamily B protein